MTRLVFALLVAGLALAGAVLRGHDLARQHLVSDEWHALHAAATCDAATLFTLMTPGATSIPMNLFDRLLLHTVRWSEWSLRLPSFLCGVALIVLAPWCLRGILSPRARLLACALLAIAPMLVFYSRYARPYAPVALLTFLTVVGGWRFAVTGRRGPLVLFVAAGVLGAFFHLVEARVFVLVGATLLLFRRTIVPRPRPAGTVLLALGIGLASMAALLGPAAATTGERFFGGLEEGRVTLASLGGALEHVLGSGRGGVIALVLGFAIVGYWGLWRRERLFAAVCLAVIAGSVAVVVLTHPVHSHVTTVVARYLIPAVSLVLVAAAAGADLLLTKLERSLGARARFATGALAVALPVALWFAGPLPEQLGTPNDFRNAKAVHNDFGPADGSLARFRQQLLGAGAPTALARSPFYDELAARPDVAAVIETPVLVGDVWQFLGEHQRVHQKRVLGGYRCDVVIEGDSPPGVVGADWPVDAVLSLVADPSKLRFHTLVDLDDEDAVRTCGASFLIVHHDPLAELTGATPHSTPFAASFARSFGAPVHVDAWITVYAVGR